MALYILLALVGVPLLEIWVFIEVGGLIGAWTTVGIVLLTGIIGTILLRLQGLGVLARTRDALDRGVMPVAEVFDGACLLVAGALLLTPGFVTDSIGVLLFVPAFRQVLGRWLLGRLLASGQVWVDGQPQQRGPGAKDRNGAVIDGEFSEVAEPGQTEPDEKTLPPSTIDERDGK